MTSIPTQNIKRAHHWRVALGLVGLSAASALIGTAPAAATPNVTTSERVRYTDLKLTDVAGQAVLDSRLRGAARRVCGVTAAAGNALESMAARRCYRPTIANARAEAADATRLALLLVRDRSRGAA